MTRKNPPTLEETVEHALSSVYAVDGVVAAQIIISFDGDEQEGTQLVVDEIGNTHAVNDSLRQACVVRFGYDPDGRVGEGEEEED